jgi:hypothetical protein
MSSKKSGLGKKYYCIDGAECDTISPRAGEMLDNAEMGDTVFELTVTGVGKVDKPSISWKR